MNSRQPWVTQGPDTKRKKKKNHKTWGQLREESREQKSGLHSKGSKAQEAF